ncbi:MAG: hypothetical protein Tp178MES00d2C33159091_5 [Prokaryotic dsDNA virus sp.]|uniref:metallophosphoesterase n=1 Tax=Thalassospira sp. TaxID=1912094 RepID=UPI000C4ABACF|nr:metallophosphoesterase [Thalassospira sp.]QDP60954.1 MAG: hypothetical protein Tp178MES00d2C33159091_5 [Prokaryotic dsDNA virus sp.]MAZ33857.1 hypothetical protein [Thalassospira sp.]MAZ33913.1 hypothetical protein [Thalassospira sp.]MAZ34650.1 hypothetical protein [Thalassospira sp.]QDP64541.1 MAG: hypothetical protein Tp178SUR1139111_61 [Prokaryotic dsDNA virus sp.]|tara:strand:+ start:103 stop:678 length:576 start_codon:yes stop_codon:yes gene_type:complete
MSKTWVYSDPHFYHRNICKFTKEDGSPLRPWDCAEEMTEQMIEWYNELVDDKDKVYILGDVAFSNRNMHESVGRLKGRKVLVPGNHEPVKMRKYFDLFDDVRGYVVKKGFIMSHIPIHEGSLSRWELNIHGHLHANVVTKPYVNGSDTPKDESYDPLNETIADTRYYCACVEHTDFRPKLLDDILKERGLR